MINVWVVLGMGWVRWIFVFFFSDGVKWKKKVVNILLEIKVNTLL